MNAAQSTVALGRADVADSSPLRGCAWKNIHRFPPGSSVAQRPSSDEPLVKSIDEHCRSRKPHPPKLYLEKCVSIASLPAARSPNSLSSDEPLIKSIDTVGCGGHTSSHSPEVVLGVTCDALLTEARSITMLEKAVDWGGHQAQCL